MKFKFYNSTGFNIFIFFQSNELKLLVLNIIAETENKVLKKQVSLVFLKKNFKFPIFKKNFFLISVCALFNFAGL